MTKPINIETNLITGEEIITEYNDEQIAALQEAKNKRAAQVAEILANVEKRKSVLEKLGLTEEEAKLLLS